MAKLNVEKKYYNNVSEAIAPVNENNRFHKEITNAIKSGQQQIYQKRIKESQVFDATWIETIEKYLNNIDNIVRHPRMFMEGQEDVVRVERAKKITSRTIAHLSAHTENVETIRDDGVIVPNKLLSLTYEDKLAIYENRFVVTLISKLAAFIEIRYEAIKDSIVTYQSDRLNVSSKFKWRNFDVDCNVDVKLTQEVDDELNRKNKDLFARINNIRMYVRGFVNTEFFKSIRSSAAPVVAPILRTNIILKQIDYNACLQLWQFMDSYRQLGFNVDVAEKNLDFDKEYEDAVVNMIICDYVTLAANQDTRSKEYRLKPYRYHSIKNPVVVPTITNEFLPDGSKNMEAPSSNEYFYQKTVEAVSDKYEELMKTGRNYKQALTTVYKQMQAITNSTYKDVIKKLEPEIPEDATYAQRRKANYMYTKKKYSIMKSIAYLKQVEAENAMKELEKLEAAMEKYQRLEAEYQEELREIRKENLRKAREARKNIPQTEKEKLEQEELNARRLAAMQAGKDKAKFERDRKEQEERELEEARLRELEETRLALQREQDEKLAEERKLAEEKVRQEKYELLMQRLDNLSANPNIWVNYDAFTKDDVNDPSLSVVLRVKKRKIMVTELANDSSKLVLRLTKDYEGSVIEDVSDEYNKAKEVNEPVEPVIVTLEEFDEIIEPEITNQEEDKVIEKEVALEEVTNNDEKSKGIKGLFKKLFKK